MLQIDGICAGYGDLKVLFDVSLRVETGECVALVGSNGVGKTTLLNVIGGHVPATAGRIRWNNVELLEKRTLDRAELGIAHIPQGRGILGTMSVYDNLLLGGYCKRSKPHRMENMEKTFEIFPKLKERIKQIAGSLSGGEQQMLAIARALIMEPKLLMLDEPSLGLAPIVVEEVFRQIRRIRDTGVSILIIEQNLMAALSVAQRGYVMEQGRIALTGSSEELRRNQQIKKAYLGI